MKKIDGKGKSVRELLGGAKYAIDYYQREYRWQSKQVAELLDDLADKFSEDYGEGQDRSAVEGYGHYFLGSIIISEKDGRKYLIDGQQRLTTLTLLLIHLTHLLEERDPVTLLGELIFSQKFGRKSFNIEVDERVAVMDALYSNQPFDDSQQPESVRNILARFHDIEEGFQQDLSSAALPYFADWLMENVHLVEITAYSDADAYTIFETMNDRGLSLTATDMLKGYLLANITDAGRREAASKVWKERIKALQDLGKEEDADGIKSWLRSQYADSIRERKRGAEPKDFDQIGTTFHRWVRDEEERLGFRASSDFARFIERDLTFYTRWYERLRLAAETMTPGLECVFFNAQSNFTLQYPVLLSPLVVDEPEVEVLRKVRVAATFLDILIARRIWNNRAIDYSTMQYAMFLVMREIRGKSAVEVARLLGQQLGEDEETFANNERARLHGMNGRQLHRLLARMTDFVETRSGMASRYAEYIQRGGRRGWEIEHVWANMPERHEDEFDHESDFGEYRNRLGGLLLLPKSFNASYGAETYEVKREHYNTQNLLARSLHPLCYEHNPGFVRFVRETGLPFRAHERFRKADLDARQALYQQLAERVWDPARLMAEAEGRA